MQEAATGECSAAHIAPDVILDEKREREGRGARDHRRPLQRATRPSPSSRRPPPPTRRQRPRAGARLRVGAPRAGPLHGRAARHRPPLPGTTTIKAAAAQRDASMTRPRSRPQAAGVAVMRLLGPAFVLSSRLLPPRMQWSSAVALSLGTGASASRPPRSASPCRYLWSRLWIGAVLSAERAAKQAPGGRVARSRGATPGGESPSPDVRPSRGAGWSRDGVGWG